MKALIAKYWARITWNEIDAERLSRSFWLQYAGQRFPDIKNASELIQVAARFHDWQFHRGEGPAEIIQGSLVPNIKIAEWAK